MMFFKTKAAALGADESPAYTLDSFPLRPPLPLPKGVSRQELFDWLKTVRVADAPDSIASYCTQDFERFVHTFGLVQRATSSATGNLTGLELGGNPYFTTMLLKQFTPIDWRLGNYFGDQIPKGDAHQRVYMSEFGALDKKTHVDLTYSHFNIEEDAFPFESGSLDIVLFCEIIEHLLNDPCAVLRQIKRVLRDDGTLVLTTPNVNRIENVARMIVGANLYDPYSGYGPYGRHNREYNKHELYNLLTYLGFTIDEIFTADVHDNATGSYLDPDKFGHLIKYREHDLGQYIFIRARKTGVDKGKKPAWLYRSYDSAELE
ncbi:methyltransferase domain-containing protein [Pseudomonas reactans]|uniref:class I SAM-dependent methyltransferase n=1 Tax=Pseudomonas reactans TaxID=117680 RepID=UPI0015A02005|nr:methyltransferase domain-containing protein [Pseudomonas reactans]NWC85301.1 methyltransferase domain-containing protein [Pseudomonas reactans]NWD31767.1 methyltransferase domain-containing protein [Pseudomonas reactans]NWF15164.1 methyltransferase domain-containing protein [Pseudomonas reactans]